MSAPQPSPKFAVVGGGISGLTAAYRLAKLLPLAEVRLFESSSRLGGVLATHNAGDLVIEHGADSFITKQPWALELCQELGIADELIPTNTENRRALVLRGGELFPVPEGFVVIRPQIESSIEQTELLSVEGKQRLLAEREVPLPADIHDAEFDDNLAHFASSRLGREAFERLVEPLAAGILTADADKLSVVATMPEAVDVLRKHGTLWHLEPSHELASGARYGSFVTPRGGMSQLVDALTSALPAHAIQLDRAISHLSRQGDQWRLHFVDGAESEPFAGVVIALPAPQASAILKTVDAALSLELKKIEYASSAVVSSAFRSEQLGRALDGFGLVVPRIENRDIVAASFLSIKFAGRAPAGTVLIRVFLGGALRPELVERTNDELTRIAVDELRALLEIQGEPLHVDVMKWHEKMPQYHVGHLARVETIERRVSELPGLALAGNAYRGVGIPFCVRSGELAARKISETYR